MTTKIIATVTAALGFIVAIGTFLNLPLRPAWAWELNDLNQKQLEYQIEFYEDSLSRVDK